MDKPQKPTNLLPRSFGGQKEAFDADKIANGYQPDVPDILGGANLNYTLDTMGKELEYTEKIADFVNGLPIGNVITTDENNKLVYKDGNDFTSGLEIGDIGMALYIDETKGKRRYLNGQIVAINDNTQEFLTRLLQIKTVNPDYFTTEENWQAEALLNVDECVYKFVLNYADNGETVVSVRLPKYPDYVEIIDSTAPVAVYGNGKSIGFYDGAGNYAGISHGGSSHFDADWSYYNVKLPKASGSKNGFVTNYVMGLTNHPDASGIVGTANLSTAQTKLKMRYFIQIATGQETEVNIVNDIELNNPYTLFDSKYADKPLYNLSWLRADNGTFYSKAVYVKDYEALQVEYNTEITAGTTVTLPSGTSYTKRGLSVKLSTAEDITDYDFVLNTSDETFRCPLKTKELTIVEEYTDGTSWYRVYSDGWCEQGGQLSLGTANAYVPITLLKSYKDTSYSVTATNAGATATSTTYNVKVGNNNTNTTDKVYLLCTNANTGVIWRTAGYLADSEWTQPYLYFYIGETVQNANLINAGRFAEVKADKTAVDGQWVGLNPKITVFNKSFTKNVWETFDLSNSLPDDNYNYELLCSFYFQTNDGAWQDTGFNIKTDIITAETRVCSVRTSGNESDKWRRTASGNFIVPIGVTRTLSGQFTTPSTTITTGNMILSIVGYRRLGTNV